LCLTPLPFFSSHDMSYSCTSTLTRASSGTVSGNVDSSSHTGTRGSSITLVYFITLSAFTPAMPTCVRLQRSSMSIGWGPVLALPSYSFISPAACGSFSCISLLLPYPGIEIWRREGVKMSLAKVHAPPVSHIYFLPAWLDIISDLAIAYRLDQLDWNFEQARLSGSVKHT